MVIPGLLTHTIHVWYRFEFGWFFMVNVGKYTSPMDGMGWVYYVCKWWFSLTPTPPPRPISPKWWFSKGNPQTNQGNLRLVKYYSVWPDTTEPDFPWEDCLISKHPLSPPMGSVWLDHKKNIPSKRRGKPQEVWLDVAWASNNHGFFLEPNHFPKRLRTVFWRAEKMPLVHVSILSKIQQANSMFPKSFGPKHMLFSIYVLSNF